jgi:large subunit ribosomal protein L3
MTKGILGRKIGMTQIFNDSGLAIPVTVVKAGPCHVLLVRTKDRDGYEAVQLGFEDKPRRLSSRSDRGQVAAISSKRSKDLQAAGVQLVAKANCEPKRFVREFRGGADGLSVGGVVSLEVLKGIKKVDVIAQTKGCGFAGGMKRWGFKGLRATHGVKKAHRSLGGTGALAANRGGGRMKKGKKMPGRYGNERVTVRNLTVAGVDLENNLLLLHGAIPGPNGGLVVVRETNKVG